MEQRLQSILNKHYGKNLDTATDQEVYTALMLYTKEQLATMPRTEGKRKLYYVSAEFLIGKLLSNNLINLGLFDEAKELLAKHGHELTAVEEAENEPSLGNGGLGRLAACFLDSIATLNLCGDGAGLNYHDGLFYQKLENNKQKEEKNPWITPESWLTDTGVRFDVPFGGFSLRSVMYDVGVPGYNGRRNSLHLFDVETVDESIIGDGISFDKSDIARNLTLFLYPDDSDEAGRLLRVYQQYFLVSSTAQLILKETRERGGSIEKLHEFVAVQINDTHPTMIIPELIRLLTAEGMSMDDAIREVSLACAYTNHTILAEALEKWPMDFMRKAVPQLVPIIEELDKRAKQVSDDPRVAILDDRDRVHMAHIDIHYGYSVNGVAALHTEILKESELRPFYELYPEKFNNKTNGITFRRWLLHCNQPLAAFIESLIGPCFKKDAEELEKLLAFQNDEEVLHQLRRIKTENKQALARYLKATQGVELNADSIFDIQVKRLHEYKRQQMNALYAIYKYLEIKAGKIPARPITMIFGAKAAPAYTIAKDIIHLILCLSQLIESDPQVSPYLKVVMVENYNVTKAEKLIPACDISEQISLASKEASGTGNMKFMLNGALTLGTRDGANVEIAQLVGEENIYSFGKSSEEVIRLYDEQAYSSAALYDGDKEIARLVDFIIDKKLIRIGDVESLCRLYKEIVGKDWFMTLLDVKEYIQKKEAMLADYEDELAWSRKTLVNIAKAGFFSSDRTIAEYNRDIWHL
ncbi:glycogen/starch/alpha-glucan phosphorylase [Gemmiger sp. An194]|uniref:glycogen/starch/alpha-glucan phosphorylase n=1 Tax=Gemmiger sp. An194 TaxID=1965582 RepID=UPI000B3A9E06|nr:glycogen/starch/alpha-glucan phosphorylase [Gemmiger sp. An194]OUP23141.1 maltose phosphorylase [Gemmiger sp. An194]